jgi:glycosyltransferase involved in cell wall biosynthesis
MRIAQVAPLYESVPPRYYGGTERIVSYLTEALVSAGHDVSLYASADSVTSARLIGVCPSALRLDENCIDSYCHHVVMMERVEREMSDFDVVHFHTDYLNYSLSRRQKVPSLNTLHGRLDIPDLQAVYREFPDMPVVSISDSQRTPLAWINWQATVHHGLPPDLLEFHERAGDYLAFLGRISPEKRVDRAIEIARKSGVKLKVAAKIDPVDRKYFENEIKHLLDDPLVEFVGEIGEDEKSAFLGNALALVFPIDWPEPFGLVMIEALACGTPVIAFRGGSVPEVIEDSVTGFVVNSVDEAVEAVKRCDQIDRRRCRNEFDQRFTSTRMAQDYVNVYERLICHSRSKGRSVA